METVPRSGYTYLSVLTVFKLILRKCVYRVYLFKCRIKCNIVIQAPQIKEMIKIKVIIRNVKVRMK